MKHKSLKIGALVSTLIISMVLVSCGKDQSIPVKEGETYKITFFNGYPGGGYFTQKVDAGEKATQVEKVTPLVVGQLTMKAMNHSTLNLKLPIIFKSMLNGLKMLTSLPSNSILINLIVLLTLKSVQK